MRIKKKFNDVEYGVNAEGEDMVMNGFVDVDVNLKDAIKLAKLEAKFYKEVSEGLSKYYNGLFEDSVVGIIDGLIALVKDLDDTDVEDLFTEIGQLDVMEVRADIADNFNNKLVTVITKEKFFLNIEYENMALMVDFKEDELELRCVCDDDIIKIDFEDDKLDIDVDLEKGINDVLEDKNIRMDITLEEVLEAVKELIPDEELSVEELIKWLEATRDYAEMYENLTEEDEEDNDTIVNAVSMFKQ